jgi:hypothetical protein
MNVDLLRKLLTLLKAVRLYLASLLARFGKMWLANSRPFLALEIQYLQI